MDRIYNPEQTDDDRQFTEGDFDTDVPATPLAAQWLNDVQEELCAVIEASGLSLDPTKQDQLYTAIQALIQANTSQATQVDIFTTSSTWTKAAGATVVHGLLIGAGGGGSSGKVADPGLAAEGGAGGSGGGITEFLVEASALPASVAVTVGIGGQGGAASTAAFNGGGSGGDTVFSASPTFYTASGGVGPTGAGVGSSRANLRPGGKGGNGGAGNGSTGGATLDGTSITPSGGAPGGGGGGGVSAAEVEGGGGGSAFCTVYSPMG
ncbi:hypothetical protein NNO07_10905, partial [Pseudomonas resinovorans]|nr:hypothetical protein [Pseudomonas resinovorans]